MVARVAQIPRYSRASWIRVRVRSGSSFCRSGCGISRQRIGPCCREVVGFRVLAVLNDDQGFNVS